MTSPLPRQAKRFLKQNSGQQARNLIAQFHHWMSQHEVSYKTLSPNHIDAFLASGIPAHLQAVLQRYLIQLHLEGHVAFNLTEVAKKLPLPTHAIEYLDANSAPSSHFMVKRFHRWVRALEIELSSLQIYHIKTFLAGKTKKKAISTNTRRIYRRELRKYLTYLKKNKVITISAAFLRSPPRESQKKPLPQQLEKFIGELALSRKSGTISSYRVSLGAFHRFLNQKNITASDIQREQVFEWFQSLNENKLHPATRYAHVINLRVYLDWLYLQGLLLQLPSKLVYKSDFPKLPEYLPRPLPIHIDQGLQAYLEKKRHIAAKGLLLMRKTGIRIGELRSLDYDCVRSDLHGNMLLKVPLGKLNNERLVPLLPATARLIENIKLSRPYPRTYLIAITKSQKLSLSWFTKYLDHGSKKLGVVTHIVSHQLRHSCATELLNGGMTLTSLMKFLGHRDIRMTLRYAKVTQESIIREFQAATTSMEDRYQLKTEAHPETQTMPDVFVTLIIKWLQKHTLNVSNTTSILKKLYRLREQLLKIQARVAR